MPGEAPVNIGALLDLPYTAGQRVLGMQTKLHRWAMADPGCRFDDLYNLIYDPAFLVIAWERVAGNTGARTAGIDKRTVRSITESARGAAGFLEGLRAELKARVFSPLPVRERMIPKANGKLRRLGIPTVKDRVVQAAVKLVLEPILEADFQPCSYGFRPQRRAQDAVEDIRKNAQEGYEWIFEADIAACFDEISHTALMSRLRVVFRISGCWRWSRRFLRPGFWMRPGWIGIPVRGPRRAAFFRRYSPILSCRSWMIIFNLNGISTGPPPIGCGTAVGGKPRIDWSGTRMTSWLWCMVAVSIRWPCGMRLAVS